MRPLALGLRAPYRLKRTIALLAQATLNLDFTRGGPIDSRVTFSRASGGTSFRPVSYGPELIASQDLSTWTSGGAFEKWNGATATATTITASGVNGARYKRIACTPNTVYRMSAVVTGGSSAGSVAIAFGTSAGIYITHKDEAFVASGVASSVLLAPPNAAFVEFAVRGGSTGQTTSFASIAASAVLLDLPGDPIQLFTAPANVPRFDYDPVSRRCKGLLIEEQRTNLLTFSNDFANAAWVKNPLGVGVAPQLSPQPVAAPDGSMTATRVTLTNTGTTSGDWSWLYASASCVAGSTYCPSAFIRASTPADVGKKVIWPGVAGPTLATLTADYKLVENVAVCGVNATFSFGPRLRGTETIDTTVTLDICHAQVEVGAFTTSRIPTTGAAATRAQDVAYIATAGWLNTSVGTMLLDFNQLVPPSQQDTSAIYFGAYPTTALTNGEDMGYTLYAANNFLTRNPVNTGPSLGGAAGLSRIALALDGTGKYAVRNGGAVLSQLGAGYNNSGAPTVYSLSGTKTGTKCAQHVRRWAFWPRRMSNLDLIGLTR